MTYTLQEEVEDLRMQCAKDTDELGRLRAIEKRAKGVAELKVSNGWDVAAAHAARVILLGEEA